MEVNISDDNLCVHNVCGKSRMHSFMILDLYKEGKKKTKSDIFFTVLPKHLKQFHITMVKSLNKYRNEIKLINIMIPVINSGLETFEVNIK